MHVVEGLGDPKVPFDLKSLILLSSDFSKPQIATHLPVVKSCYSVENSIRFSKSSMTLLIVDSPGIPPIQQC